MALPVLSASRPALRFRLFGLPIRIDVPFLVLAAVIGANVRGTGGFVAGAFVVLVVFLAHELGHAAAEQSSGLRPTIDLTWFGGVTTAEGMETLSRVRRILVFVSGPAAGAVVGGLTWRLGADRPGMAGAAARLALLVGVVEGVANLLPVLPLDGGRLAADLLPGTRESRLRRARTVSVVTATLAAVVAIVLRQPILALLPAWLAFRNLVDLRSGGASQRAKLRLVELFVDLDASSAETAERAAREALEGERSDDVLTAAGNLLLASHLVRGQHREARAALAGLSPTLPWAPLRDLVVLGELAESELDRRLGAEPTEHDVGVAAIHRSLVGQHDQVADLAESRLGASLDARILFQLQSRAFHAGAFRASVRLGEATEARRDARPAVPYNVACAWARLGDHDRALAALERAARAGFSGVEQLDSDDDLAPLRDHEAYPAIRRRMRSGHPERQRDVDRTTRRGALIGLAGCAVMSGAVVLALPPGDGRSPRRLGSPSEIVGVNLRTGVVRWQDDVRAAFARVSTSGDVVLVSELEGRSRRPSRVRITIREPADGKKIGSIAGRGIVGYATHDGRLLVEDFSVPSRRLRDLDIATGAERWWVRSDTFGPARVIGGVGLRSSAVGMQALDLDTGAELWERDDLLLIDPGPRDVVVARSENGHRVVSLDPRTGRERWSAVVDGSSKVLARNVWVDESPGERVLIDVGSGERRTLPVDDVTAEPLLETDDAAILRTSGGIRAVDLPTGRERWRQPADRYGDAVTVGEVLVARSSGAIVAHDLASGAIRWKLARPVGRMATADDTLLLSGVDAVEAIDAHDGHVRWTMETRLTVPVPAVSWRHRGPGPPLKGGERPLAVIISTPAYWLRCWRRDHGGAGSAGKGGRGAEQARRSRRRCRPSLGHGDRRLRA